MENASGKLSDNIFQGNGIVDERLFYKKERAPQGIMPIYKMNSIVYSKEKLSNFNLKEYVQKPRIKCNGDPSAGHQTVFSGT